MSLLPVPTMPPMPRANVLSNAPQTVYVRPMRSIGGLYMDVTVEESHTDELEITEHPVEQGAAVTDHAYLKPAQVTIKAGVSDSTVGKAGDIEGVGDRRSVQAYQALLDLQGTREPFDVVTGKRVYRNMLIKSLGVTTEKNTENVISFSAELRQVILVSVRAVAIPRRRRKHAKTGDVTNKGQVQAEPKRSGLSKLFGRS